MKQAASIEELKRTQSKAMMSERATIAPDKTALNDDLDENDFLSVDLD